MWLLMLSVLYSIISSQAAAPVFVPEPGITSFSHSGAVSNAKSDSCQVCHAIGSDLTTATNQLCFECHKTAQAKASRRYQHPEVTNEKYPALGCDGCHRLHNAAANPLLARNETELCYSCHPETKDHISHPVLSFDKGYGLETISGPDGKVIDCASHCHDMHGTDFKYLCSKEPGRELCISCHKEFQ